MKTSIQRIIILLSASLFFIFSSCTNGNNQGSDTEELMTRTERMEQEQEQMERILSKAEKARDSLIKQQNMLIKRKQQMEGNLKQFDSLQSAFTEMQRKEREEELNQERSELQQNLAMINDSLKSVTTSISGINAQLDTLSVAEKQLTNTREMVDTRLVTGINEIDRRLDKLENEAILKSKQMEIEEQKLTLASNKVEVLEDEKIIYQREKSSLVESGAEQSDIKEFEEKIQEVNKAISDEQDKIDQAQGNLVELTEWMSEYRAVQDRLKDAIDKEYTQSEILAEFAESEINRLSNEKRSMKEELQNLQSLQKQLKVRKSEIDSSLTNLDEEIDLVQNQELSDLLMKKSRLESEEAELLEEETALFADEGGNGNGPGMTGVSDASSALIAELDQDIRAQRAEIEEMKREIAQTKMELSQKQAQIDERRSNNAKVARISALTIILIGIGVLLLFYFLGRYRRTSKA